MKAVVIKSDANISKTLRKKINTYSNFEPKLKSYVMSCHLIGQLGKIIMQMMNLLFQVVSY